MPMKKADLKRATRERIIDQYEANDCSVDEKKAGVTYYAVSVAGSNQRIAAIYGSLGGGASIWVKESAFQSIKDKLNPNVTKVEDVDLFKRGFQWAIHFDSPTDPIIDIVVNATIDIGRSRWEKTLARREADKRRAEKRAKKDAEMAQRKRDPWS